MDQDPRPAGSPLGSRVAEDSESGTRTPEEIRADIEKTRAEVGDTVEALAEKTDVKAQAQHRVDEIKDNVRAKADEVKAKARETTPESAQQGGQQIVAKVRANPVPLAAAVALLAAFLLGRRSGRP
jgi:ElaB/YqjD/DUF883 family membrane-anchored ribosome-binding protein